MARNDMPAIIPTPSAVTLDRFMSFIPFTSLPVSDRLAACTMPIRRKLDSGNHLLRTTITGAVTITDLREHLTAVHEMQGADLRELIDTRGASLAFSARELPKLAEHGQKLFSGGAMAPRAIVVTGVIHFGMARLFASLVAPWVKVSVFDNLDAAEAWVEAMILAGI